MQHHPSDPTKPVTSSPGPTTPEGKKISSRNATKHGCCSTETLILATESEDEFKSLETAWFRSYDPKDLAEVHLVHQLVHADWFLQRSIRTVARIEAELLEALPNPMHWDDRQHGIIARFLRYQTSHTNNVAKRQKAVEDYRKNRAADVTRAQVAKQNDMKTTLVKTRIKVLEEKNKPEESWGEHLEGMRRKAISLGFTPPPRPDPTKR